MSVDLDRLERELTDAWGDMVVLNKDDVRALVERARKLAEADEPCRWTLMAAGFYATGCGHVCDIDYDYCPFCGREVPETKA